MWMGDERCSGGSLEASQSGMVEISWMVLEKWDRSHGFLCLSS